MPVNKVHWYDNTDFFHYNLSAVSTAGSKIFRVIIKITEKECILLYIIDHKRKGIKVGGGLTPISFYYTIFDHQIERFVRICTRKELRICMKES